MKVIFNPAEPLQSPSVVTVGTFDGLHLGHQEIIRRVQESGQKCGLKSTLVTFEAHPKSVLIPGFSEKFRALCSTEEKIGQLASFGLDQLVILSFDHRMARMTYPDFIEQILLQTMQTRVLIMGYDHSFGRNRDGNFNTVRQYLARKEVLVEQVQPFHIGDDIVSSSRIREFLNAGKIEHANALLGRKYGLTGTVIKGDGRGRLLNFPTANLSAEQVKLVPAAGVYACDAEISGKTYRGMLNIGTKPTFSADGKVQVEVHIIDFNENIYGEKITVLFKRRLRSEIKFTTAGDLIRQLEIDKNQSQNL